MRYTLFDSAGFEQSIAIEASDFSKPYVRDPKTGAPTSYEALGFTLGFSDDSERAPHSPATIKLAEKGARTAEQRATALVPASVTTGNVEQVPAKKKV